MTIKSNIFTIILTFIGFFAFGQEKLIDRVIAKVGTEYILLSDVEDQYAYALQQDPTLDENIKCQILQNIIAQKVIIFQAKLDSIEVTEDEVNAQLDLRFDNILNQMNGDEQFFREYYGAGVTEMKERFRDDQRQQILANRMQQKLINSVKITPSEVKEFYQSIPKDSLPFLDSEVELGELIIVPKINETQKSIAREKLEKIRTKIISGEENFEEMALKNSMDPGSAARGGDLGFAKRGTYVPEFEAVVFGLHEGEISEVFESPFGFHIIKLIERRGNSVRARHILIKPDITQEDLDLAKKKLDSIKTLIEIDSISFEKAVKKFSDKNAESYNNNGRMKNRATGNNFFKTEDLDFDIYEQIIDMKPGDLSDILEFTDRGGEVKYKIIKLFSMTRPHQANLKQDYDKIAEFAKESKKAEYFNKWIAEKMKETFISVNARYNYCDNLKEYIN